MRIPLGISVKQIISANGDAVLLTFLIVVFELRILILADLCIISSADPGDHKLYTLSLGLGDIIGPLKFGYVDTAGALRVPLQYTFASAFDEAGYAAVRTGDLWGFIDQTGTYTVQPQYTAVGSCFRNNMAAVKTEDGWGYIDSAGNIVIQPRFEFAGDFSKEGIAKVMLGGKYCYINTTGKYIADTQFQEAKDFSGGLALVTVQKQQGLLKPDGTYAAAPGTFIYPGPFTQTPFLYKTPESLYGYMDSTGAIVVQAQYSNAQPFRDSGYAAVCKDGLWGLIDQSGNIVLDFQYETLK